MPIATLIVRVAADVADFEKSFAGLGRSLQRSGRELESIGSRLTQGITLPLAALAGVASKAAIDFESSFAGVRKTVNATEGEFRGLAQGFRDLAKTIPLNVNELNRVGEAAGQLGIKTQSILGFTEVMAKLGVTTNLSADQAATSLARLANITQLPQSEFEKLGSTIVALGNNFATTEAELVEFGLRIAGAGKQVGLTEAEILAFGTALSSVGINAEAGGTAISKVFIELASRSAEGGRALRDVAAVAGQTGAEFKRAFETDAAAATVSFVEGLGRISAAGGDVFGVLEQLGLQEVRVRDALLRASGAGDLLRQSLDVASTAWRENTALAKEAEERFKTTASQLGILKNNLNDAAITLGQAFLPLINDTVSGLRPLVQGMADLATRFGQLPEPLRNATAAIVGLVAAIGPLTFAIGKIQQGWAAMLAVLGSGALSSTITLLGRFAGPIGLVSAAVLALKETWDTFQRSWVDGGKALASALPGFSLLDRAVSSLRDRFPALRDVMDDVASIVKNTLIVSFREIRNLIEDAADVLVRVFNPAWDAAANALERVGDVIRRVVVPALTAAAVAILQALPGVRGLADLASLLPGFGDMAAALDRTAKAMERAAAGGTTLGASTEQLTLRVQTGDRALDTFRANMVGLFSATTKAGEGVTGLVRPLMTAGTKLDEFGRKVKDIRDDLSGAKLAQDVRALDAALKSLDPELRGSAVVMARFADAALKLSEDGGRLTGELADLAHQARVLKAAMEPLARIPIGIVLNGVDIGTTAGSLPNVRGSSLMAPLVAALERDFAGIDQAALKARDAIRDFGANAADQTKRAEQETERNLQAMAQHIDDITNPLMSLASELPGIAGDFTRFGVAAASALLKVAAGAITMDQAMQSLRGGAYAVLFQLIANGLRETFAEARPVTQGMRDDFARQFGGRQGLELAALMSNTNLSSLDSQTSAAVFETLTAPRIQRAIEAQQQAMEKYGLTWRDFGIEVRQAQINLNTTNLVRDFRNLTKAGIDSSKVIKGMSSDLNQLIIDSVRSGTQIPRAIQPILEQLIRTRNISEEAARALLGIADDGMPALEDIRAAAERYGLTLDQLGPKVKQLEINDTAKQIAADFKILTDAGASAVDIAVAMKDKIQDIITTSFRLGIEVPASLRPIIQVLIDMGLLVDANGVKLESIDDINFGRDLVSAIDDLIAKLGELIDQWNGVADAADRAVNGARPRDPNNPPIGGAIPRPPGGTTPTPPPPDDGTAPDPNAPPPGARTPSGTNLSPSTSTQSVAPFTSGQVTPTSGGSGLTATFVMNVDGNTIAEATVPYIPGVVQRFGLA